MIDLISKLTLLAHYQDKLNNYKDVKELEKYLSLCNKVRVDLSDASENYGRLKLEDFYNKDFIEALLNNYNTAYPNNKII